MSVKKAPGRFTLHFNLKDPQQRMVSELLEQQGRHKAQFITNAVMLYMQYQKPQGRGGEPPAIDEAAMERMLLAILEKHPQFLMAFSDMPPKAEKPLTPTESWGDDALKAVSDTLAAFQQKS